MLIFIFNPNEIHNLSNYGMLTLRQRMKIGRGHDQMRFSEMKGCLTHFVSAVGWTLRLDGNSKGLSPRPLGGTRCVEGRSQSSLKAF